MLESRREIIDRYLAFVGELADPVARTVAEQLLDAVILGIWIKHPFRSFLMPDPLLVPTVAGTRSYILPPYFGRVASRDKRLQNMTTGNRISALVGEQLYDQIPGAGTTLDTQTGPPSYYQIAGMCGVNVQVSSAGVALEALSDNANDSDVTVVVEGLDAQGVYTVSQATLPAGSAPVALGTFTKVQNFSKMWPTSVSAPSSMTTVVGVQAYTSSRGNVSLRLVGGAATVYQKLLPWESLREQWVLSLYPAPDAVYSLGVPVIRLPRRSLYDADPVPSMWGPAIFEQMLRQWKISTGEDAAQITNEALIDLVAWDNSGVSGARQMAQPFGGGQL